MNLRKEKGSISIFVLVGLLFMTAFMIISYGNILNKSKSVAEQFKVIKGIYSNREASDDSAYEDAYTDLRKKNKQTLTASVENSNIIDLPRAYNSNLVNYRIYGNSIQNEIPTIENPIPMKSVGEKEIIKIVGIENTGKNLLDKNESTRDEIANETAFSAWSEQIFDNNWVIFNLEPNETYTISYEIECIRVPDYIDISSDQLGIYLLSGVSGYMNINMGTIRRYLNEGEKVYIEKTFTTPNNINEIEGKYKIAAYTNRYRVSTGMGNSKMIFRNLQIEKGNVATSYEAYNGKTAKIDLQENESLKKVGKYVDYIDYKTQKVYRNVGVIASYNGENITTDWMSSTGELSNGATVYYGLTETIEEDIELPAIEIKEDDAKFEIYADPVPSKIEVQYTGYTLD